MIKESNTKKKTDAEAHSWLRHPKSQGEKREYAKSLDQGVQVRGKRSPKNLGDLYDDKSIPFKKQNSKKKSPRKTIRKGEEEEQSVTKKMKQGGGKTVFDGPKVKDRKRSAPATKVENPKKGKGSYNRKKPEELNESASIIKFIEAIMTEDHAKAHKYLKDTINRKIQEKISQEIEKPLF